MAITGYVGGVFIESDTAPIPFINELTQPDNTFTRYQVINPDKKYWNKNSPIAVYINNIEVISGFNIETCGGVVALSEPLSPQDEVTVSGESIEITQKGGFFNWSCELSTATSDKTVFNVDGWKENTLMIKGFNASAESYWINGDFSKNLGNEVIVALYIDTTESKRRYEGYAIICSDGIESNVDDIIKESIEFEGVGKLYYREG